MNDNDPDKISTQPTEAAQQPNQKPSRKRSSPVVIGIVLLLCVVIGVGTLLYTKHIGQNIYTRSHESPDENKFSRALSDEEKFLVGATNNIDVKITKDGFTPAVVTVKPNTKVTWITDETASSYGIAANAGSSVTQYFGSKTDVSLHNLYAARFVDEGTYTYHDTKNPTHNGTIIVAK